MGNQDDATATQPEGHFGEDLPLQTAKQLLYTTTQARNALGLTLEQLRELVRTKQLVPFRLCDSEIRFHYEDLDLLARRYYMTARNRMVERE